MCSLLFATLLHASTLTVDAEKTASYAEAHRTTCKTGKPMVVMVSAPGCMPCQQMKRTVLPQCRRRGLFKRVTFCVVDANRQQKLARKLTGGGPVPQLIMFRKTRRGWARRKLIGSQSVESVERFVKQGIALDETTKKTPQKKAVPKQPPPKEATEKSQARPVSARQQPVKKRHG